MTATKTLSIKKSETATYTRRLSASYAVLEDGTVMKVQNAPGCNSLIVWKKQNNINPWSVQDALEGEPISEEEFLQAVRDYFTALEFPGSITLNK